MSDLADTGAFSLGIANNISQNFGPTATATQANTNANTALTQQQAQAAAIQNANARLQYQLFARGVQRVTDFSGQDGPNLGAGVDDSSGVTADYASPASAPPAGTPSVPPTPEDDIGQSASKQALIESWLEREYNVNPTGTNAEQGAILQAQAAAVQAKLSGNSGLAAAAEQRIQMLVTRRDQNVKDRQNAVQLDASQHYDKLSAVEAAPDGQAFDTLTAIAPNSATLIQKQNPDATPEELDELARDTTAHVAAFVHRFTNRETTVGEDGATYDKQSGLRVDVPIRGVSPDRQAALLDQANKIVTTENSDGSKTTEPQFRKDGYNSASTWVTDAVAQIRARNGANTNVEAAGNHAIQFGHLTPGAPPVPGGTLYRPPQQGGQQPGTQPGAPGAQPGTPQPGASPQQPQQQQQQQRQQPAQPPPGDPQVLRQALTDPEYKLKTPPVIANRSQTPGDADQQKANVAARQSILKDSSDLTSTAAQAKAYTDAALAVLNSPDKPPTGLAAPAQVALSRAVQAIGITGGDWATRSQELAKYMGNLAVQNFKANFGARPAAKEFDIQLNELNPNNKMTPAAISNLLQSNSRIAQYGIDSGRRAGLFVSQGGDPNRFAQWNEQYFPRSAAVNAQTPPTRPGQQTSGQASGGPAVGTVRGGYKYAGGDPSNKSSWVKQ